MRHADSIFPLSGGGARAQAGFHPVAASLLVRGAPFSPVFPAVGPVW